MNVLPTIQRLNELFDYDSYTGKFKWKKIPKGQTNQFAGSLHPDGYIYIKIDQRRYPAHRLAWKILYGHDPETYLDHIDGNRENNRIDNLRLASIHDNNGNSAIPKHNTSGYKGVTWHKKCQKWQAQIGDKYLGLYETPEKAHSAYIAAATNHFGQFASDGVRS